MSSVPLPFKGRWSIWQEIIQIEDGHSVNTVFSKIDVKIVFLKASEIMKSNLG